MAGDMGEVEGEEKGFWGFQIPRHLRACARAGDVGKVGGVIGAGAE